MRAWNLLLPLALVGCHEITDDRMKVELSKFTSSPPAAGRPIQLSVTAQHVADFRIKQGSKVIDWGITIRAPYSTTVTAVSDETPVLEAWDYRLKLHTLTATIAGAPLEPEPPPNPEPTTPVPVPKFEPMATFADGGLNCSKVFENRLDLSVQNLTQRTLQPVWINYMCEPFWEAYSPVGPGAVFVQNTFSSHVFQFYDVDTFEYVGEITVPDDALVFYTTSIGP